ncbi:hypothetical protein HAP94_16350 [Acidithiobacillus ferrivorans]|nr:hypothetical protein [Acidithiobacillus ferrivorans]
MTTKVVSSAHRSTRLGLCATPEQEVILRRAADVAQWMSMEKSALSPSNTPAPALIDVPHFSFEQVGWYRR